MSIKTVRDGPLAPAFAARQTRFSRLISARTRPLGAEAAASELRQTSTHLLARPATNNNLHILHALRCAIAIAGWLQLSKTSTAMHSLQCKIAARQ